MTQSTSAEAGLHGAFAVPRVLLAAVLLASPWPVVAGENAAAGSSPVPGQLAAPTTPPRAARREGDGDLGRRSLRACAARTRRAVCLNLLRAAAMSAATFVIRTASL